MYWLKLSGEFGALSSLTIAEMAAGIEALLDGKRKRELEKRLRFLQEDYADRILPFDEAAAWEWARYTKRLRLQGLQTTVIDSMIAAIGLVWGPKVVTRNVDDFPLVQTVNPFLPG